MHLHELKIEKKYFLDVLHGAKTFELRKNDRNYQVGDLIHFNVIKSEEKEHDPEACDVNFGEDCLLYKITYVLKDVPKYGLDMDYCILGIKHVKLETD